MNDEVKAIQPDELKDFDFTVFDNPILTLQDKTSLLNKLYQEQVDAYLRNTVDNLAAKKAARIAELMGEGETAKRLVGDQIRTAQVVKQLKTNIEVVATVIDRILNKKNENLA